MKLRFFSYDPEVGIEFHETLEQAKKDAEDSLAECRDLAPSDGWPENTGEIIYGEVNGGVVQTASITVEAWEQTHDPEDEPFPCPGFDEMVDYELQEVKA